VRIVSLLPSATEIVCLLGLEDQLVGVSADSDWPVEAVKRQPVLNTVSIDTSQLTSKEIDTAAGDGHRGASQYHVDSELLRNLRPGVYTGNKHLFSRSVPRLVDAVEALARKLHPECFSEPIPPQQVLKVSFDGQRLERYQ
jgi:iron complex transport system substrate-binding protein